jgi:hypothetical protein
MFRVVSSFIIIVSLLLSSCSTKFSITKKRYSKGYHVEFARAVNKSNSQVHENKQTAEPVKDIVCQATNLKVEDGLVAERSAIIAVNQPSNFKDLNVEKSKPERRVQNTGNRYQAKQKYRSPESATSKVPYNYFWSDLYGSLFIYIIGTLVSMIIVFLFYLFLFLLANGSLYAISWFFPALVVLGIIAAVVIAVVLIMNSD